MLCAAKSEAERHCDPSLNVIAWHGSRRVRSAACRGRLVVLTSRVIGAELLICLPADARSCRIEGIAYTYIYALACMFLPVATAVNPVLRPVSRARLSPIICLRQQRTLFGCLGADYPLMARLQAGGRYVLGLTAVPRHAGRRCTAAPGGGLCRLRLPFRAGPARRGC